MDNSPTSTALTVTENKRIQLNVASIPKRFQITPTMAETFICDPAEGAKIILNESLDAFQSAELKKAWFTPRVMDSSGFSSGKSIRMWMVANLRAILMPDHWCVVYYQFFEVGQRVFWANYARSAMRSRLFSTQIGNLDAQGKNDGKATRKGQSTWTVYFKNSSKIELPAGGFDRDSINQAGTRTNDLFLDEWTKVESTGSKGIDEQLIGRATRETFNKEHPFWANKIYFLATAEDTMHPSYSRYIDFKREVDRANPEYVIIQRSFKDYSNLKYDATRTFKEVFVDKRALADMRKTHTVSSYMQEALGLWSRNGKGWYTVEAVDKARASGIARGVVPLVSKLQDAAYNDLKRVTRVHYFMGVDPARAETTKAADGAIVILRAEPKIDRPSMNMVDWNLDFVWAYKVRRADAPQWAAIMHRKNRMFDLSMICMDSQGGGNWIRPELGKEKQIIRGEEISVQPICCIEEEALSHLQSLFILSMFKIQDNRLSKAWSAMRMTHPSNLVDISHCEFKTTLDLGVFGFPAKVDKRDTSLNWTDERIHANQMLDLTASQLTKIVVKTNPDGTTYFNNFGAREFGSKGRKDFAYAAVYAFTAFFSWLKSNENNWWFVKPQDRGKCGGGSSMNGVGTSSRPQNMADMAKGIIGRPSPRGLSMNV